MSFQVDIGIGDEVTPKAELATVPSFLNLPAPEIRIYPVYTVIAENFRSWWLWVLVLMRLALRMHKQLTS